MPDPEDATTGPQPWGGGGTPHGDFSGKAEADEWTEHDLVRLENITLEV